MLDLPNPVFFIHGLVASLIAHLFYTVLFFRYARKPSGSDMAVMAGLILFAGLMMWVFRGIDPDLFGPVVACIVVIITMTISALLVLAVNKFLMAVPYGRVVNITLYFLAQFAIITAARAI